MMNDNIECSACLPRIENQEVPIQTIWFAKLLMGYLLLIFTWSIIIIIMKFIILLLFASTWKKVCMRVRNKKPNIQHWTLNIWSIYNNNKFFFFSVVSLQFVWCIISSSFITLDKIATREVRKMVSTINCIPLPTIIIFYVWSLKYLLLYGEQTRQKERELNSILHSLWSNCI